MTSKLRIADNVFVCITDGHAVFLDLDRDAYSAVPVGDLTSVNPVDALIEQIAGHRDQLIGAGLLTHAAATDEHRPASGRQVECHVFGEAEQRAFGLGGQAGAQIRLGPRDVADFMRACWSASRDLRSRSISQIVGAVRADQRRLAGRSHGPMALRCQVAIFSRLRPFYPRSYLCLFDALALVRFLAHRDFATQWVFGVHVQPFAAHCWVQQESILLNEQIEYAARFTPIMIV